MSATEKKLRRCIKRGHKVDWSRPSHSAAVLDVVDGEVFYPAVYECKRCGALLAEHMTRFVASGLLGKERTE